MKNAYLVTHTKNVRKGYRKEIKCQKRKIEDFTYIERYNTEIKIDNQIVLLQKDIFLYNV